MPNNGAQGILILTFCYSQSVQFVSTFVFFSCCWFVRNFFHNSVFLFCCLMHCNIIMGIPLQIYNSIGGWCVAVLLFFFFLVLVLVSDFAAALGTLCMRYFREFVCWHFIFDFSQLSLGFTYLSLSRIISITLSKLFIYCEHEHGWMVNTIFFCFVRFVSQKSHFNSSVIWSKYFCQ